MILYNDRAILAYALKSENFKNFHFIAVFLTCFITLGFWRYLRKLTTINLISWKTLK